MRVGIGFWGKAAGGDASPANLGLANLHAWYDASDATTLTVSSGSVDQWRDKSGNAFHLGGSAGANRPTTTTIGGRGAVAFAAVSEQRLTNAAAATAFRNRQIYTVAGVWRHNSGGHSAHASKWAVQQAARAGNGLSGTDWEDYWDSWSNTQKFGPQRASATGSQYIETYGLPLPAHYDGAARVFVVVATATQLLQAISGAESSASSTNTLPNTLDLLSVGCCIVNSAPMGAANGVCCELAFWLGDHWAQRAAIRSAWQTKWSAT